MNATLENQLRFPAIGVCLSRALFQTLFVVGLGYLSALGAPVPGVSPHIVGTLTFDRNNTFGWRFTPMTDIDVVALGYFDGSSLPSGTAAGLSQMHDVGIYRVSDQALLASNTVPAGTVAALSENYRYVQLDRPIRLSGGETYVMAAFGLSITPDGAAAANSWVMAPGIVYANSPAPTLTNPTGGTSQYLVSAHGNPPAVLTYPALAQTGILPGFAANFQFLPVLPLLTGLKVQSNSVVIGATNLTAGVTHFLEQSEDLATWQPFQSFVATGSSTNLAFDAPVEPAAFFRIRVTR